MGTRADFYLGRGKDMKWLGSTAWDSYPEGIPDTIKNAKSEAEYLRAIEGFSLVREDWTPPEQGWPWPWEDSGTTDYAYAFDGGEVWVSPFGDGWFKAADIPAGLKGGDYYEWEEKQTKGKRKVNFPNMESRQRVTYGPRSGVVIIGGEPPEERLDVPGSEVEIRGTTGTKPGKVYRRPDVRVREHERRVK